MRSCFKRRLVDKISHFSSDRGGVRGLGQDVGWGGKDDDNPSGLQTFKNRVKVVPKLVIERNVDSLNELGVRHCL